MEKKDRFVQTAEPFQPAAVAGVFQKKKSKGHSTFQDNRSEARIQRNLANSTSNQPIQKNGKPGDQPASLEDQMAIRLQTIWIESNKKDDDILKGLFIGKLVSFGDTKKDQAVDSPSDVIRLAILHVINHNMTQNLGTLKLLIASEIPNIHLTHPIPDFDFNDTLHNFDIAWKMLIRETLLGEALDKRNPYQELSSSLGGSDLMNEDEAFGDEKFKKMASFYLKSSGHKENKFKELDPEQKNLLTKGLLNMPVVNMILYGGINQLDYKMIDKKQESHPEVIKWLVPEIVPGEENVDAMNPKIVDNINTAIRQIVNMVDPKLLANLPVPKFVVHKNPDKLQALRDWNLDNMVKYRASASRNTQVVNIAENEKVEIIVHEIGHQLEFFLPSKAWVDIQRMLRMRHGEMVKSGKKDELISIHPYMFFSQKLQDEAAFQSKETPVTGEYSKRYYTDGATEVMSKSMEFFSQPGKAKELIFKDPLQAAIILRAIQPDQFRDFVPQEFWAFLP